MDRLRCQSQLIAKAFVPTKRSPVSLVPLFFLADRSPKKSTNFRPTIILEYQRGKVFVIVPRVSFFFLRIFICEMFRGSFNDDVRFLYSIYRFHLENELLKAKGKFDFSAFQPP